MGLLFVAVAVAVVLLVARAARGDGALATYQRHGDRIVVEIHTSWAFAMRRTLTASVSDVVGATVLDAGESTGVWLRTWGTWWPGFQAGHFWGPGPGRTYVLRRRRRPALDLRLHSGRPRHWIVEVDDPWAAVADIASARRALLAPDEA